MCNTTIKSFLGMFHNLKCPEKHDMNLLWFLVIIYKVNFDHENVYEYKKCKKLWSDLDFESWKLSFHNYFHSGNWAYFLAKWYIYATQLLKKRCNDFLCYCWQHNGSCIFLIDNMVNRWCSMKTDWIFPNVNRALRSIFSQAWSQVWHTTECENSS